MTKSEEIFERFLELNNFGCEKIHETHLPTPDYIVKTGELKLYFEVKELSEDENFKIGQVSSRTVGEHVRKKIAAAKKQIQATANKGIPSILLIYNNIDPLFQAFGTEDHDFIDAMYGEDTVVINKSLGRITDSFHGETNLWQ